MGSSEGPDGFGGKGSGAEEPENPFLDSDLSEKALEELMKEILPESGAGFSLEDALADDSLEELFPSLQP